MLTGRVNLAAIYELKERFCALLRLKHQSKRACRVHIQHLLGLIAILRQSGLDAALTLVKALSEWTEEIGRMWRFNDFDRR